MGTSKKSISPSREITFWQSGTASIKKSPSSLACQADLADRHVAANEIHPSGATVEGQDGKNSESIRGGRTHEEQPRLFPATARPLMQRPGSFDLLLSRHIH